MNCIATRCSALALVIGLAAPVAFADGFADGNEVNLLQDSTDSGSGNELFIDQSDASNSRIGLFIEDIDEDDRTLALSDVSQDGRARQIGGGNSGEITIEGEGAVVSFLQGPGSSNVDDLGNTATIEAGSLATVVLAQQGSGNEGRLEVRSPLDGETGNTGQLFRNGDGNDGTVIVAGSGVTGILTQNGNGNDYSLDLSAASLAFARTDTTVVATLNGDDLDTPAGANPIDVFTNSGGTITITQTRY